MNDYGKVTETTLKMNWKVTEWSWRVTELNVTEKVGHSSNFLYQGFAEKYFLSTYIAKLKTKNKIGCQCASYSAMVQWSWPSCT